MHQIDTSAPHVFATVRARKNSAHRDITDLVTALKFTDSGTRRTNKIELTLDGEDGTLWGDDDLMRKGGLIHVEFGYPGAMRDIGDFSIKKVKGGRQTFTLECYQAKRNKMVRTKKTRVFTGMKHSDVVRILFRENGFSRFYVDNTDITYDTITQSEQSDWEFLQELADLDHYELFVDGGGAHYEKPKYGAKPKKRLRYIKGVVGVGMIEDWDVDDIGSKVPGRIVLKGWDSVNGQPINVVADGSLTKYEALNETDDVASPAEGDATAEGEHGQDLVLPTGARNYQEAKKLADSLYKTYRHGAVKVTLKTVGDPWIFSRTIILVEGIGPYLDGRFYTKEVVHSIGGGYGCEIKANKDGLNRKGKAKTKTGGEIPEDLIKGDEDEILGRGHIRHNIENI